jgi:hypothetical protein
VGTLARSRTCAARLDKLLLMVHGQPSNWDCGTRRTTRLIRAFQGSNVGYSSLGGLGADAPDTTPAAREVPARHPGDMCSIVQGNPPLRSQMLVRTLRGGTLGHTWGTTATCGISCRPGAPSGLGRRGRVRHHCPGRDASGSRRHRGLPLQMLAWPVLSPRRGSREGRLLSLCQNRRTGREAGL